MPSLKKYPEPIRNWLQTLVSYTQNYLQTEEPTIINPKPSENEASNVQSELQKLATAKSMIIPVVKEASLAEEPQITPPHRSVTSMEKRIADYTKKIGRYSKIRDLGPKKETSNHRTDQESSSNQDEFVKIIASNDSHPQFYVQTK